MLRSVELVDVRAIVARSVLLLALAAALILLPGLTPDPGLRAIVPGFAVLMMLHLAPLMWSRKPDLFSPPVLSGILSGFATAATLASMYVTGEVTLDLVSWARTDEAVDLAQQALLASIVGTLCYYVGYYTRLGVRWSRIFPNVQGLVWDRFRLILISVVALAIFVVTYAVFQSRVGVSLWDFTQLGAGKRVWREDPTLSWMLRGIELGFLPVLLFASLAFAKQRGVRSLVVPGAVLLLMALLSFRLGQRGTFAYVLLTVLILFHYHRWRIPAVLFLLVYFVGMAMSNIMLEWRNAPEDEPRTLEFVEQASDPTMVLANHESERQRFSSLALIMSQFPDEVPYLMGKSWASIVAVPIPRWLWPSKVNYFEWQDDRIIYKLVGAPTPPPYVGVLYANLSWIGIVLGTLLFGAFHRGLYEWQKQSGGDQNVVLLYALLLIYFGPSMMNVSMSLQYVLPVWLVLRFVGRRPAMAGTA